MRSHSLSANGNPKKSRGHDLSRSSANQASDIQQIWLIYTEFSDFWLKKSQAPQANFQWSPSSQANFVLSPSSPSKKNTVPKQTWFVASGCDEGCRTNTRIVVNSPQTQVCIFQDCRIYTAWKNPFSLIYLPSRFLAVCKHVSMYKLLTEFIIKVAIMK